MTALLSLFAHVATGRRLGQRRHLLHVCGHTLGCVKHGRGILRRAAPPILRYPKVIPGPHSPVHLSTEGNTARE